MGHIVCVFSYQNKYSMFSNQELTHNYDDYLQIGHAFYPDGLKYMEVRDWRGVGEAIECQKSLNYLELFKEVILWILRFGF